MSATDPTTTPEAILSVAKVASAFVQFYKAYASLEKDIRAYSDDLTEDQRAMVARWIGSASVMVLGAHKAMDDEGRAQ